MAKKAEQGAAADQAAAPSAVAAKPARRSNVAPAAILALGLVVGGFLMGRGGSGSHSAAAAGTTTTVAEGHVAILDPVTMNLADGRYLKVTLALHLKKGIEPKEFLESGHSAKALDLAMSHLSHHSSADLQPPKAREKAREELSEAVLHAFHGEVLRLYVTEWVVQ